jgi:hypothetical protein
VPLFRWKILLTKEFWLSVLFNEECCLKDLTTFLWKFWKTRGRKGVGSVRLCWCGEQGARLLPDATTALAPPAHGWARSSLHRGVQAAAGTTSTPSSTLSKPSRPEHNLLLLARRRHNPPSSIKFTATPTSPSNSSCSKDCLLLASRLHPPVLSLCPEIALARSSSPVPFSAPPRAAPPWPELLWASLLLLFVALDSLWCCDRDRLTVFPFSSQDAARHAYTAVFTPPRPCSTPAASSAMPPSLLTEAACSRWATRASWALDWTPTMLDAGPGAFTAGTVWAGEEETGLGRLLALGRDLELGFGSGQGGGEREKGTCWLHGWARLTSVSSRLQWTESREAEGWGKENCFLFQKML